MTASDAPASAPYRHVQRGRFHWMLHALAAGVAVAAVTLWREDGALGARAALVSVAAMLELGAACFARLRVQDEGEHLAVAFGPLPLLRRRVRWDRIVSAAPSRSWLIEGWGIHWFPGRGWTWNLWGRDTVKLALRGGRTLRVGTDDPEGLATYVNRRLVERARDEGVAAAA